MSIIIAAMIAASAAPQTAAALPSTPSITAPVQAEGGASRVKPVRYCVTGTITGSRFARKTCRTRDAWLAEGFDPLATSGR